MRPEHSRGRQAEAALASLPRTSPVPEPSHLVRPTPSPRRRCHFRLDPLHSAVPTPSALATFNRPSPVARRALMAASDHTTLELREGAGHLEEHRPLTAVVSDGANVDLFLHQQAIAQQPQHVQQVEQ
jgi:hypothetical protein